MKLCVNKEKVGIALFCYLLTTETEGKEETAWKEFILASGIDADACITIQTVSETEANILEGLGLRILTGRFIGNLQIADIIEGLFLSLHEQDE